LIITIEENSNPPEELWDPSKWYAHGFSPCKEYNDFPIRDKAVTIIEKRRRWKQRETQKTTVTPSTNIIEAWTWSPSDLLYFLK